MENGINGTHTNGIEQAEIDAETSLSPAQTGGLEGRVTWIEQERLRKWEQELLEMGSAGPEDEYDPAEFPIG